MANPAHTMLALCCRSLLLLLSALSRDRLLLQTERLFEEVTGRSSVPERFTWAQALVLSRSFGLSEDGNLIGLIPFLDMLNHSETANMKLHVDARRNQV